MSRISAMMHMGKDSLMNSQAGLHTVGHNIANKGTRGYTRQRVETQSATPLTRGNLQVGNGARLSAINRVSNQFGGTLFQRLNVNSCFIQWVTFNEAWKYKLLRNLYFQAPLPPCYESSP